MRNSTFVVALLAATVASGTASAKSGATTPRSEIGASAKPAANKPSAKSRVQSQNARQAAAVPSVVRKPSTRATVPASLYEPVQVQTRIAPARTPSAPAAARMATAEPKRATRRNAAEAKSKRVARLSRKSRTVALNRDVATPAASRSADLAAPVRGSIPAMVSQMAARHGVSPALAHAVVKVESRYQPRATGKGGYIGLMQLSYQTARGMGFRGSRQALYEPNANLTYGMKYLAGAVAKSGGNTCAAVSKYQGGHAVRGVTRAGAVYCSKVKRFMSEGIPASAAANATANAEIGEAKRGS